MTSGNKNVKHRAPCPARPDLGLSLGVSALVKGVYNLHLTDPGLEAQQVVHEEHEASLRACCGVRGRAKKDSEESRRHSWEVCREGGMWEGWRAAVRFGPVGVNF